MDNFAILSDKYTKLVVMNQRDCKEIAIITNESIITASDDIVIKLTPLY